MNEKKEEIVELSVLEFKSVIRDKFPRGLFVAKENDLYFAVNSIAEGTKFEAFPTIKMAKEWLRRGSSK